MIYFDKQHHLLEQHAYDYRLQDIENPNLYRDLFPFTEVPKISFNHREVPMNMPDHVYITDTTFRDG